MYILLIFSVWLQFYILYNIGGVSTALEPSQQSDLVIFFFYEETSMELCSEALLPTAPSAGKHAAIKRQIGS